MAIVVHYAPQSRASIILWALEELGVPYEKVRYDLAKGEHKTPAFAALNPNCKVPTLVVDGTPMFESLAELLYVADRFGAEKKLWPEASSTGRLEALSWTTWATVTLGGDILRWVEATSERVPEERRNAAQGAFAKEELARALGILEARLEGRAHVLGDAFSMADVMMGAAVAFASRGGFDLAAFPRVAAYTGRLVGRPSFGRAMAA